MTDQQDKSEQATQTKLEDARKKGSIARSPELLSFIVIAVFLVVFSSTSAYLATVLTRHTAWWISHADHLAQSWPYLVSQAGHSLEQVVHALFPLIAALVVMIILASLIFNGPVFSVVSLKPDFKRLNPVAGFKKMFSRRMLVELLKVLVKGIIFFIVLYVLIQHLVPLLLRDARISPAVIAVEAKHLFMIVGFSLLGVLALSALFDMWYSRKDFARQMMMSRREVKDEHRRREGDPEIKSKRRQIQQQLSDKVKALGQVQSADVILTNPTHYAVALRYRSSTMQAPMIVAMGQGSMAKIICMLARRHGVPIMRRPPLARQLSAEGRINGLIPQTTQQDVVDVYRWIISLPNSKVMTS